jgi:nicotinamidase-related amidase
MSDSTIEHTSTYPAGKTALVVVDPFNDFLSKGGLAWPIVKTSVQEVGTIEHVGKLLRTARENKIKVVYAPHHHYRKGSHSERKYLHPVQVAQLGFGHIFSQGKWGGEFIESLAPKENEFVASEHACSSGFADTDLHEHLQSEGITHVIVIGMVTNSCIEATARSAIDLDYHVTLVTDAVAAFSPQEHEQAVRERYPLLGHIVGTTENILEKLKSTNYAQ